MIETNPINTKMNSYVRDKPGGQPPANLVSSSYRSLDSTMQNMTNVDEKEADRDGCQATLNASASH
jgi:hypothetical protein